jgi:hypothetical protein
VGIDAYTIVKEVGSVLAFDAERRPRQSLQTSLPNFVFTSQTDTVRSTLHTPERGFHLPQSPRVQIHSFRRELTLSDWRRGLYAKFLPRARQRSPALFRLRLEGIPQFRIYLRSTH